MVATSLLGELKRRNVFRAAALYAAAAWLLVQIATQVFPFFHVPEWVVRGTVVAAAIGLPPFIAFAWFYEFTPEGLKRQSEVEPDESIVHLTARKLDRWIIVLLGFIAVLMLADMFVLRKPAADAAATKATATDASVANSAGVGADSPAAGSANTAVSAKSIAVLPFENLSKEADNAYFATGMQDEILTRLAGIRDLKVISRTSTVQYASHPPNLKVVAEQLGVATVLEGSVQKAGEQVHINLQLIDAHNDSHLWAQSYNRELKDIFAVEAEVAQNVADALKAQLVPTEAARVAAVPTQNPVAYELYLRANSHANRAYDQDVLTPPEIPPAITLYKQALGADPRFALAAAALARAHMSMYFYAGDRTESRLAEAKTAADNALALQPGLGEAHHALALYYYWGHRDYAAATEQLQLARQTMPNSADVVILLAAIERRQGRGVEAVAGFQQATLLDPRSSFALDQLAFTYAALHRYAEADRAFAQAVAVTADPKDEQISLALNNVAWKGDVAPLRASLAALEPGSDAYTGNLSSFYVLHWWSRDYAGALNDGNTSIDSVWSDQTNVVFPRNLYLAWAYQAAGETAKASEMYSLVQKAASAALSQQPDVAESHLALAFADAGLGLKAEAVREARRAKELLPASRDAITGAGVQVYLAQVYVRVGDNSSALDELLPAMQLLSGQFLSPALLKLDPNWDPLRKDPRFEQLLALGEGLVDGTSAR